MQMEPIDGKKSNLRTNILNLNLNLLLIGSVMLLVSYLFITTIDPDPSEFNPWLFILVCIPLILLRLIQRGLKQNLLMAKILMLGILLAQIYFSGLIIYLQFDRYQKQIEDNEVSGGIYNPIFLVLLWSVVGVVSLLNIATVLKSIRSPKI
jgi:O-antigen/teichoic acid export membrane protein